MDARIPASARAAKERQEKQPPVLQDGEVRIGLYVSVDGDTPIPTIRDRFCRAEAEGFHTAWAGQVFEHDALTLLALAGTATRRIELGSWVLPIQPRHPVALAQQALTVQAACAGRLLLGLGVSHEAVVEKRLGLAYEHPLRRMRECLDALQPLLAGERTGEHSRVHSLGTRPPPVFLAALGPLMLRLAGARADGVALWLGGPRFLAEHALPHVSEGAARADRPTPRIVCGLPVAVTSEAGVARRSADAFLARVVKLPAYARVLALEGVDSPGGTAIVGDEASVRSQIDRLGALGATDFNAILFPVKGDPEAPARTRAALASLATRT